MIWQSWNWFGRPEAAEPRMATPPPPPTEMFAEIVHCSKSALLVEQATPPPVPEERFCVMRQLRIVGEALVSRIPAPIDDEPFRMVKPAIVMVRGATLVISTTRAALPPEMMVEAGPFSERIVSSLPEIEIGDQVPGPTRMVVPFGAALMAAWMLAYPEPPTTNSPAHSSGIVFEFRSVDSPEARSQLSGRPLELQSAAPSAMSHESSLPLRLQSVAVPAARSHESIRPLPLQSDAEPDASSQESSTAFPLQSAAGRT